MSLSKEDLQDQLKQYRGQLQQSVVATHNIQGAIAALEHQLKLIFERDKAEILKAAETATPATPATPATEEPPMQYPYKLPNENPEELQDGNPELKDQSETA